MPGGVGQVNDKGLEFYDKLVDELLGAGIQPYVTLFHWDYPYELFCRGGWLSPDSPQWFADYTQVVVEKLGDRVKHWMTLNEPQCFIGLGHHVGNHAPGLKYGFYEVLRAMHNTLLAHGRSVQAIRAASKGESYIGFAPVGSFGIPDSDSKADLEAARRASFSVKGQGMFFTSLWCDPVFFGRYPEDALKEFDGMMPPIADGDMEIISQPCDFFGANIYRAVRVKAADNERGYEEIPRPAGDPRTEFNWPVTPECLYWGPKLAYERYGKPVYVTENGMADVDWVSVDGEVHDPNRVDYLTRHLQQLRRASEDGVEVHGYFQWSIMDNFEWAEGYSKRFGIVHVDYETQQRTLKDSAKWYREVIRTNGGNIPAL
jgi:beta-glucosidase